MPDLVQVVTPIGKLNYVQITGKGKLNYNEDGHVYVATLHLTGEKANLLKSKIDEVLGEIGKGEFLKSRGYRELLEDDKGVYAPTSTTVERDKTAKPTGIFAFTFSTATTFSDGKPKTISIFDSSIPKPRKINLGDKKIGNGSEGAISGNLKRYKQSKGAVGVSLFLNAIQISKFVEYIEDAGFSGVEDGYTGEDESIDTSTMEVDASAPSEKVKPKL